MNMTEIKKKKLSLSNPYSIYIRLFFLVLRILNTLSSLVNLTSLLSLPILVNLTKALKDPELNNLSNGTMAMKSMENQPFM